MAALEAEDDDMFVGAAVLVNNKHKVRVVGPRRGAVQPAVRRGHYAQHAYPALMWATPMCLQPTVSLRLLTRAAKLCLVNTAVGHQRCQGVRGQSSA